MPAHAGARDPSEALAPLSAPSDPRAAWDLPAFGTMPQVSELDELTVRVLAPNPSHMTLDGTNTYVVGERGSGAALVIDPGPDDRTHKEAVDAVLRERDLECVAVVVTHHHSDHCEAAAAWAVSYGCPVAAPTREVAGEGGQVIGEGDRIDGGGVSLVAVATPGHCGDHTAFRAPTGALLTGDHILGRGTSVVAWPDGDLASYLESLQRVLAIGPDSLYPGHGPELTADPGEVIRYYVEHRRFREQQILAVLGARPARVGEVVRHIYAQVDRRLWPAAERSTRAALEMLSAQGRVEESSGGVWSLVERRTGDR